MSKDKSYAIAWVKCALAEANIITKEDLAKTMPSPLKAKCDTIPKANASLARRGIDREFSTAR
ncbi:MAG: hypothetical protein IPJ49_30845 [Candidatus Obscuribacter sp.]|nr:hypothetical protein [Candidatus Obscuribacter sp.]